MSRHDGNSFFEGIIFGGIIGAILGLLYAPQSGEKTRAWLQEVKDEHQDEIDDAVEKSEKVITTTKAAIEDGFNKVSKMIDQKIKDGKKKKK